MVGIASATSGGGAGIKTIAVRGPMVTARPFQDRFKGWVTMRGVVLRCDHERRAGRPDL